MDENERQTITYYDRQAELWAANRLPSFWHGEIDRLRQLSTQGGRLLEVGSGVGAEAGELAKTFDYTGLDLSEKSLEVARRRYPDFTFLHESLYSLPFEDGSFDVFWSAAMFPKPGL